MKAFARVTRLPNIGGRGDYIVNPEKQENVVAASEKVDWSEYQKYEREHQKTTTKNNEGREMIIMLPNEWSRLPTKLLHRIADKLVKVVAGDREAQWAMHWNKAKSNFHIHIIYSERQREKNPGCWDRDIYLTEDGKVARRKADRARNEDGSFKPPIHRKGDLKDGFTAKDPKFATKAWLHEVKGQLRKEMEKMGVRFEKAAPLHEFHEGKGSDAPRIHEKNIVIRENNRRLEFVEQYMRYDNSRLVQKLTEMMKNGSTPVLSLTANGEFRLTRFDTPSKAIALQNQTMSQFQQEAQRKAVVVPTRSDPTQQTAKQPEKSPPAGSAGTTQDRAAAPEKVSSASADLPPKEPPSFTALIAADKNFRQNQAAVSRAKSDLGMERPVNRELTALPDKLREAAKNLKSAYWSMTKAQEQMSHLYAPVPPGFLAGKKKKREYEADLAEYNAQMTPLKTSVSDAKKSMQENLDIILPHMEPEEQQRQGYGREAPIMTAENVSFGDIDYLDRRI
ncbi:MAG: hypothetical protein J6A56_03915, partial [Clostridia bacterium]|nr:hypothetical protein [Clostridia bacterium]